MMQRGVSLAHPDVSGAQAMVIFVVGILVAFWLGFLSASVLAMSRGADRATDRGMADRSFDRDGDPSRPYLTVP